MPTFGRTSDSIVVNPTIDRYTATTSQTVFTLTATPSSQMLVWVNGILQEPTTHYTISGRTLTLGTACTVGDKVAAEYGTGASGAWWNTLDAPLSSSMADLTSLSGTWAISGGVLAQTNNAAGAKVRSTTKYATNDIAVQIECRLISGTGVTRRMGIIPQYDGTSGDKFPWFYIQENGSGTWIYNCDQGDFAGRGSVAGTGAYNTWRTILVVYSGRTLTGYVDGTLIGSFVDTQGNISLQPYIGLYTYLASVEFRNLKVWNLNRGFI